MIHSKTADSIDAEEHEYLFVKDSQIKNAGNGLFTAIKIYPDEIIALFHGELLSHKEALKRVKCGLDHYFISLLDGRIFDSMNASGFAHFANDAFQNSPLKNNARIALDAQDQIALIASSTIHSGTEIFCSYGKNYWKKHALKLT